MDLARSNRTSLLRQEHQQVVPCRGHLRMGSGELLEMGQRLLGPVHGIGNIAQPEAGCGFIRPFIERGLIGPAGRFKLAGGLQVAGSGKPGQRFRRGGELVRRGP